MLSFCNRACSAFIFSAISSIQKPSICVCVDAAFSQNICGYIKVSFVNQLFCISNVVTVSFRSRLLANPHVCLCIRAIHLGPSVFIAVWSSVAFFSFTTLLYVHRVLSYIDLWAVLITDPNINSGDPMAADELISSTTKLYFASLGNSLYLSSCAYKLNIMTTSTDLCDLYTLYSYNSSVLVGE